jgi:hypothetical protein
MQFDSFLVYLKELFMYSINYGICAHKTSLCWEFGNVFLEWVNGFGNGWKLLSDMLCLPDPKFMFLNPILFDLPVLQSTK